MWSEGVLQIGEHEPWLDDGLQIAAIDLEDLAHARERDDDAALRGDRAPRLAGARTARDHRRVRLVREGHHALHLLGRRGDDDDIGHAPQS